MWNNEEKSSTNIAHYKSKCKHFVLLLFPILLNKINSYQQGKIVITVLNEIKGFMGFKENYVAHNFV